MSDIEIKVDYFGPDGAEYRRRWLKEWAKQDPEARKRQILLTVDDLISGFFYYDRKEDEYLEVGAIEWSVVNQDVTLEEIIVRFGEAVVRHVHDSHLHS